MMEVDTDSSVGTNDQFNAIYKKYMNISKYNLLADTLVSYATLWNEEAATEKKNGLSEMIQVDIFLSKCSTSLISA